jgi:hypothetical protein
MVVDSGASRHMMGTHEFFTSWSETNSDLHVELGTHAKCGVEGVGIVRFQLESRGFLEVENVLYVPELKDEFSLSLSSGGQGLCSLVPKDKCSCIQRELALTQQSTLVSERVGYTGCRESL